MASFGSWVVESIIRFSTNGPETMARLSSASAAATAKVELLTGAVDRQSASFLRNQLAAEKAALAHKKMLAGIAGGIALAGAAISAIGIDEAAKLQSALLSINIATGTGGWRGLATQVSTRTAQSVTTIAQELATAASSGLTNPAQLRTAFPQIAQAADVLFLGPKKMNPVTSVGQLSQLAHLFGAYHGKALSEMLDKAVALMYTQPEALNRVLMQGKMFIPLALSAGVSSSDLWSQILTMGQTGFLRGRGGAGLAMIIRYLSGATNITAHMSAARRLALYQLGMFDAQGNLKFRSASGKLELGAAMSHLYDERKRFDPTTFVGLLLNAFGQQGGRYAAAIMRPAVHDQAATNIARINAIGHVTVLFDRYMSTFAGSFSIFVTDIKTILTDVFYPLLPTFTSWVKSLDGLFGWLAKALAKNKFVAGAIGTVLLGITGGFTVFAATMGIQALFIARNIAGISASLSALATGTEVSEATLAGSLGLLDAPVAAVVLGISALVLVLTHLKQILNGFHWIVTHYNQVPNQNMRWDQKLGRFVPAHLDNYFSGAFGPFVTTAKGGGAWRRAPGHREDGGATTFNVTQHFHGHADPDQMRKAVESLLQHHQLHILRKQSPHKVTSATLPMILSTGQH